MTPSTKESAARIADREQARRRPDKPTLEAVATMIETRAGKLDAEAARIDRRPTIDERDDIAREQESLAVRGKAAGLREIARDVRAGKGVRLRPTMAELRAAMDRNARRPSLQAVIGKIPR